MGDPHPPRAIETAVDERVVDQDGLTFYSVG